MILLGILFILYSLVFTLHVNGFIIAARIQEIYKLVSLKVKSDQNLGSRCIRTDRQTGIGN